MVSDLDSEAPFMGATYRALCRHGYASLTMQDIADESDRSKSALHYHYDTKHDLLVRFLDYLFEEFTARIDAVEAEDPAERLRATVGAVLARSERTDDREFRTAMLELRAQAPYDDDYRERLAEFDRSLRERVRETVAAGIEQGVFRADADPGTEATFVVTVIAGAGTRRVTLDCPDCPVEAARALLDERIEGLLAEGTDDQSPQGGST